MSVLERPQPITLEQPAPPHTPMTFDEFLAWADEDTKAEWVDGEVEFYMAAAIKHQRIKAFLMQILYLFVRLRKIGEVFDAPTLMRLRSRPSGREPDILFVARKNMGRLTPTYLDGPADLVIEIVSPESVERDRVRKFAEYEQGGVREYWLIDPDAQTAEFYQLKPDGHYQRVKVGADDVYHSREIKDFWLRVAWLWQDPLPLETDVLRELQVL